MEVLKIIENQKEKETVTLKKKSEITGAWKKRKVNIRTSKQKLFHSHFDLQSTLTKHEERRKENQRKKNNLNEFFSTQRRARLIYWFAKQYVIEEERRSKLYLMRDHE